MVMVATTATMPTGWTATYSSAVLAAPTYWPTMAISNPFADSWQVQYINTAASVTPPWRIIRSPFMSRWEPAAPALIRRQEALRRAQEQAVLEMEQTARQLEEQRQAAAARARALLLGELDPVQREQFLAEGFFVHIGRRGVRYRIRTGISANIDVLRRSGRVRERLCVHPMGAGRMPAEDVMLAQLLHLRHAEAELLEIANHHPALAA
jgi:hypothetical protein